MLWGSQGDFLEEQWSPTEKGGLSKGCEQQGTGAHWAGREGGAADRKLPSDPRAGAGWAWLPSTAAACSPQQPCPAESSQGSLLPHTAMLPFILALLLRPLLLWQAWLPPAGMCAFLFKSFRWKRTPGHRDLGINRGAGIGGRTCTMSTACDGKGLGQP